MDEAHFLRRARHDLDGPLHGVRVLDLTKVWAGPMASAILADLGADVIRIELPGTREGELPPRIPGTRLSWFRQTVHRNKRSAGADLRSERGRAAAWQLLEHADVVVENYLPGTLESWGLGYEQVRVARPDLVWLSISGWGQYGPRAQQTAYDPTIQAATGWMALNGPPGGRPARAPTFLADDVAALYGAIGALAALAHRNRTGEGQQVDVAMFDALLAASSGLPTLAAAGAPPQRQGNRTDFVVPADVYACEDGELYVAAALDGQWQALCRIIGRRELATAPGYATARERLRNREAIDDVLAGWCATRSAALAEHDLVAAGIPAARVRTMAEAVADSHTRARRMLQEVELSDGSTVALLAGPIRFSRTPTRLRKGAPAAGEDEGARFTAVEPAASLDGAVIDDVSSDTIESIAKAFKDAPT